MAHPSSQQWRFEITKTLPTAAKAAFPARLIRGYHDFLDGRFSSEQSRYRELAQDGQKPRILLIGCSDSRVSPEVIFDARPGEIFVVRNVANLAPPFAPNDDLHGTSAALEFAVMGLRVEHIVVMGHAGCGGVRAYADNEADPSMRPLSSGDFIGKWVKLLAPAYERVGPAPRDEAGTYSEAFIEKLALESIKQSLTNLRTFPCVKTLEERGKLALHGAFFGIMDGVLRVLDPQTGVFERVERPSL